MDKNEQRLAELFGRYTQGKLSASEEPEFYRLIDQFPLQAAKLGKEVLELPLPEERSLDPHKQEEILRVIFSAAGNPAKDAPIKKLPATGAVFKRTRRLVAAAVIVAMLIAPLFWISRKEPSPPAPAEAVQMIAAGNDGAILTREDGTLISLDSLRNGTISLSKTPNVRVVDGILSYEGNSRDAERSKEVYHTINTPKGRQYRLKLSDGTQVWLNAGSSIKYPVVFNNPQRNVEVTGELYFDVARDKDRPFRVSIPGDAHLEVLGTEFNVNAYKPDSVSTTLAEGKISIKAGGVTAMESRDSKQTGNRFKTTVLIPGQQAVIQKSPDGQGVTIALYKQIDVDQAIAWKNGLFNFEHADLAEIMHQLERWYDIQVKFEGPVPEIALYGKINRGVSLNDLLPALKKMGLNYKLQGRELIILN